MSRDPSLRELLSPMVERTVDLEGDAFCVDRTRVIARMAEASRRDPRRQVRYALAAGAMSVVLAATIWRTEAGWRSSGSLDVMVLGGSATRFEGDSRSDLSANEPTRIPATGELETIGSSQARVRTADGVQIELRSQTRVVLDALRPDTNEIKLVGGAIRCTIPRRAAGHAFRVVTPEVTVVDLGTVFTVSLDGPNGSTRISVEEGEVLIRGSSGQTALHAPDSWPSTQEATEPRRRASATATEPVSSAAATALAPNAKAVPSPAKASSAGATLAREAYLLRRGLASERQGRAADAISALTELVTQYPDSPMVPDAEAALARVKAAAGQ